MSYYIPDKRLHAINHPVHGKVYPVISSNMDKVRPRLVMGTCLGGLAINGTALYSLFVDPILQDTVLEFMCHPLFIVPAILWNA